MTRKFTELEKTMLINAHPVKMLFNIIGAVIGCYFLWFQDWLSALIFGLGTVLLGTVISLLAGKYNPEKLAGTLLGRFHLYYTSRISFVLYLVSHVIVPYAFWIHNLLLVMLGVIFLLAGALIHQNLKI